jgi:hypothetical protein
MNGTPVPEAAVGRLVDVIERTGIAYAMMGGLALNAWGIPRATYDLDATLAVRPSDPSGTLAALHGGGVEVDPQFLSGWLDELAGMKKAAVKLLAAGTWFSVDLFFATTPFLESVLQRRVAVALKGRKIFVVGAADLVLFKLVAGRRKDWVDIENVLAVQGVPDREYLRSWADRLGVAQRLERVLGDAGLG